jgi:hypothetical protein
MCGSSNPSSVYEQETKGPVTKVNSPGSAASVVQQPVQPVTQTSDRQPQAAAAAAKKVGFGFEDLNFGLGLGLRASMPKLPSFRVCNQHNIAILFAYTP